MTKAIATAKATMAFLLALRWGEAHFTDSVGLHTNQTSDGGKGTNFVFPLFSWFSQTRKVKEEIIKILIRLLADIDAQSCLLTFTGFDICPSLGF
ncbi:hypothetical protein NPIL_216521 [Nephila pilipes]|uniref:Secreted protein n=1 Tax=Nephila pilipes TaxID=299642 RepID=A0A8X6TA80_NEPPI|nr:hypothetical protein NPIL_216521 [Nephila pilipes]